MERPLTGTQVAYWYVCRRKLWLVLHGICLERESDLVADGKNLGERAYARRAEKRRELELPGVKIDYYDAATRTVHETKRSPKLAHAHRRQLQYYLLVLRRCGVADDATGVLEYPRQKRREEVLLTADVAAELEALPALVEALAAGACPAPIRKGVCRNCAFAEYCYSDVDES